MSAAVARPTFYEGEVLPAGDLVATVEYARAQMARHDRYLHSWGIASGLVLTPGKASTTVTGASYKPVTLTAGIAIDGTGREIVVPEDLDLSADDFLGDVVPLPAATTPVPWYPVFLNGLDQAAQPSSNLTGACDSSLPTRTQETSVISYGAPGSELNLNPPAVGVTDPPGDGSSSPWRILLGFVQWSQDANNFADAATTNDDGETPRYVGVNAAQITSKSGVLLLATHPAGSSGKNPVMAVEIQEADNDGKLVFGKLNADGTVTPVLTVEANGNLTAAGQISGAVTPGSVQVQSGLAFDGMLLPLPIGIDPADVDAGKVTLNIHVSPHMDGLQTPSAAGLWLPASAECRVDNDTRQVHCRIQWFDLAAPAKGPLVPGFCDYTVIAAVPAVKGNTP